MIWARWIPDEILNNKGTLPQDDFDLIQRYSLDSARLILHGMVAQVTRKAGIMIPAFEYQLKADRSSYPVPGWRESTSLSGRIIAVCDAYDALTSAQVHRRLPMSGDRAWVL